MWLWKLLGLEADNPPTKCVVQEGLFLATESQSVARAAAVLPTEGSEDARHILGSFEAPARAVAADAVEYLPDESIEWVVTVSYDKGTAINDRALKERYTTWRKQHDATLYGRDEKTSRWSFALASDGFERMTALQFAWSYVAPWNDEPPADEHTFKERWKSVEQLATTLGRAEVSVSLEPGRAVARQRVLQDIHARLDRYAIVVLKAPQESSFGGRDIWDVMLSLGLQWGDMDLFHWKNASAWGDDMCFSVRTSTTPGYFLPEDIAAGKLQAQDLIFGFSIPRSHDPRQVLKRMIAAAEYSQTRLGGALLNEHGSTLDRDLLKADVDRTVEGLEKAGFVSGTDLAMRFF